MKSIKTAVVALVLGAGLAASAGVATAGPVADGTGSGVGILCTRQYVLTGNATLRDSPGGNVIGYAITGDKFNVPSPSGNWYEGNLYDQYNTYLGHGYILASALAYTGTCF